MNQKGLMDLLKAGGYDDVDNEATVFAPHLSELSRPVLQRVRALKKLQLESLEIETKFYHKVYELEKEFQPLFDAVNAKRREIVLGNHEPDAKEADIPLLHGVTQEALQKIEDSAPVEGGEPSKGIPSFWFNTLNSVAQLSDIIKEYDEPILKYLVDITTESNEDVPGYALHFHFTSNPYFTNNVLTKYYELEIGLSADEPFEYDGPTVVKSRGCEIDWKQGKNPTQKIMKTKQRKGPNAGKFITKTVPNESFFNFFNSSVKTMDNEMEHDEQEKVREDFELGQILRDQVISRAVLFYTGEASCDDMLDDDYEDEEEDEEGDDENGKGGDGDDDDEESDGSGRGGKH